MKRKKFATLVLLMSFLPSVASADTLEDALAVYQEAMATVERAPRVSKFRRAENLFRRVIEEFDGNVGADLYVNIGNAALEAGRVGHAVVAFHKAISIDPSHRQAKSNLAYVRSTLPDWVQADESVSLAESIFFWKNYLSPSGISIVASLVFLFVCLLFAASRYWQKPILTNLAILPFCVWGVLIVSTLFDSRTTHERLAIVVADEVTARSADSLTSPSRFSSNLPSGTELRISESRDGWSRVTLADDQTAWIPDSAIEIVTQ